MNGGDGTVDRSSVAGRAHASLCLRLYLPRIANPTAAAPMPAAPIQANGLKPLGALLIEPGGEVLPPRLAVGLETRAPEGLAALFSGCLPAFPLDLLDDLFACFLDLSAACSWC